MNLKAKIAFSFKIKTLRSFYFLYQIKTESLNRMITMIYAIAFFLNKNLIFTVSRTFA